MPFSSRVYRDCRFRVQVIGFRVSAFWWFRVGILIEQSWQFGSAPHVRGRRLPPHKLTGVWGLRVGCPAKKDSRLYGEAFEGFPVSLGNPVTLHRKL